MNIFKEIILAFLCDFSLYTKLEVGWKWLSKTSSNSNTEHSFCWTKWIHIFNKIERSVVWEPENL